MLTATATGPFSAIDSELDGRIERTPFRDDAIEQTPALEFLGGDSPSGQGKLHGTVIRDAPRQAEQAAGAGHDPDTDLGEPEDRGLRSDDEVARKCQLEPSAERIALNRRDERGCRGRLQQPVVRQVIVKPPSTTRFSPVMNAAASDAKNRAA